MRAPTPGIAAEAETRNAYVGAIRALALALDARDPYTAGHSERVSPVSVAIGRQVKLLDEELDILRLGALLHDPDVVVRRERPKDGRRQPAGDIGRQRAGDDRAVAGDERGRAGKRRQLPRVAPVERLGELERSDFGLVPSDGG
jgi:hypothetical protein